MVNIWNIGWVSHPFYEIELARQLQESLDKLKDKQARLSVIEELDMPNRSEELVKGISDLKAEIKANVEHYNIKI